MSHSHTYSFAGLEISQAAYDEIKAKLERVGDLSSRVNQEGYIDMIGLAVTVAQPEGDSSCPLSPSQKP